MLIAGNARAREVYERAMADAWAAKNELLDRGAPREIALYLLPNAKAIRLVETGSLLHLLHKWTMRTCFNAQEEIYQASMEEVEQVRAALPSLGQISRAAVLHPRRDRHADLHRRLALLRRESLAGISKNRAANLIAARLIRLSINDAPRQPRLLPRLVDLRRIVPDGRDVLAGTRFAGRNGDRSNRRGRRDHHDVFPGAGFLRVSFRRVCVFAAAFHAIGCTPKASGSGLWPESFSLCR